MRTFTSTSRASQINHNSTAIIADGSIKKSHVVIAATYIWSDVVTKELQINSINVTPLKAKLMAICTGLIPAMEIDDIHDITVITDSITAAKKILESKVDLLQNMFLLLASAI